MNRLYQLESNDNKGDINYGITNIFNSPCIYSIIEPDIIEQIKNMKRFNFEGLNIKENLRNYLELIII